ncbi:MAG: hypothetical protein AAFZ15_07925 [Bacteroidota bacterium]
MKKILLYALVSLWTCQSCQPLRQLEKFQQYDHHPKFIYSTTLEYTDDSWKTIQHDTLSFNDIGLLESHKTIVSYPMHKHIERNNTYKFSKKKVIVKFEKIRNNQYSEHTVTHKYDKHNNKVREEYQSDIVHSIVHFKYNSNGDVEEKVRHNDKKIGLIIRYEHDYDKMEMTQRHYTPVGDLVSSIKVSYDEKGNEISKVSRNEDQEITMRLEFTYNEHGDETSMKKTFFEDGVLKKTILLERAYKYNAHNAFTEKKFIMNGKPDRLLKKEFVY